MMSSVSFGIPGQNAPAISEKIVTSTLNAIQQLTPVGRFSGPPWPAAIPNWRANPPREARSRTRASDCRWPCGRGSARTSARWPRPGGKPLRTGEAIGWCCRGSSRVPGEQRRHDGSLRRVGLVLRGLRIQGGF